jgi:hypothetical protein
MNRYGEMEAQLHASSAMDGGERWASGPSCLNNELEIMWEEVVVA